MCEQMQGFGNFKKSIFRFSSHKIQAGPSGQNKKSSVKDELKIEGILIAVRHGDMTEEEYEKYNKRLLNKLSVLHLTS